MGKIIFPLLTRIPLFTVSIIDRFLSKKKNDFPLLGVIIGKKLECVSFHKCLMMYIESFTFVSAETGMIQAFFNNSLFTSRQKVVFELLIRIMKKFK